MHTYSRWTGCIDVDTAIRSVREASDPMGARPGTSLSDRREYVSYDVTTFPTLSYHV